MAIRTIRRRGSAVIALIAVLAALAGPSAASAKPAKASGQATTLLAYDYAFDLGFEASWVEE